VTSVGSGSGLTGGPITSSGTLSIASGGVTNAMLANDKVTLNASSAGGLTVPGAMTLGSTYAIGLKTCSSNQVLQYNGTAWACASVGTGTVTSVGSGTGLTGGPITSSGSLSIDTTVVPELAATNTFTTTNTINGNSGSAPALNITNAGWDGIDILAPGSFAYGIFVENGGVDGIYATGGYLGGQFSGPSGGSFSYNNTDSQFEWAGFAYENGVSQQDIGFEGYSASSIGIGVYGQTTLASATGFTNGAFPVGVWGDSGDSDSFGVMGSVDEGWAFVGYNDSNDLSTLFLQNNGSGGTGLVVKAVGKGGECNSDVNGNFNCSGSVAAVASVNGGATRVALSAIHSPEDWFEDAGSGQLSGGEALVNIESLFGETVNTGVEYHVFLTPNGDCKGLYVAQKSATSFVVKELGGGTSSISFDYRIMAKRKGSEAVRLADRTEAFSLKGRPNRPVGPGGPRGPNAQELHKQVLEHTKHPVRTAAVSSAKKK
jgi:hypothetical protein